MFFFRLILLLFLAKFVIDVQNVLLVFIELQYGFFSFNTSALKNLQKKENSKRDFPKEKLQFQTGTKII